MTIQPVQSHELPSAAHFASLVEAVETQRARLFGDGAPERFSGGPSVRQRFDPDRPLARPSAWLAKHLRPDDVLLDVGGGAGRLALALAPHCREVVNVDASTAMLDACRRAAAAAGIQNVRTVAASWPQPDFSADVVVSFHVVFFVRDIVPFLEGLTAAARRRVVVGLRVVPTPHRFADLFRLVYGEPMAPYPTFRELLPVLWDLGLVPEVRVLPDVAPIAATPEDALEEALHGGWIHPRDRERARPILLAHFVELFAATDGGYELRLGPDPRQVLVTRATDN
jgi:SAM-dependent methyltransferase